MWHALQISANSGMLPLPCAVDDGDRLLVGVEPERREDERQRDLLRAPLDEHHRP